MKSLDLGYLDNDPNTTLRVKDADPEDEPARFQTGDDGQIYLVVPYDSSVCAQGVPLAEIIDAIAALGLI